jgi:NAD+ kinase
VRVHLLVNPFRKDAIEAASKAAKFMAGHGVEVAADSESAAALQLPIVSLSHFSNCDLAVSLGGDGTVIKGAGLCAERGTPILGVYFGRFGFVTQCTPEELEPSLKQYLAGEAMFEERIMLQIDLMRGGQSIATIHGLNEVVVQRSVTVRMLMFGVKVDGVDLTTYPADGVILCTATGSTAYNLSAGGPIMDPRADSMILTALAPHTLSARPLILPSSSVVELSVAAEGDAVLSCDGQSRLHMLSGDQVCVQKSPRVTRLMIVRPHDFLHKLPQRLFWSQSAHEGKE